MHPYVKWGIIYNNQEMKATQASMIEKWIKKVLCVCVMEWNLFYGSHIIDTSISNEFIYKLIFTTNNNYTIQTTFTHLKNPKELISRRY